MVDKIDSTSSQWNGDFNEGYKQVSRQGAVTSVTTMLSIGPWGRLNKRILAQTGQVGRKCFLEEVKPILKDWYKLARDQQLFPASRWQEQHLQCHKESGHIHPDSLVPHYTLSVWHIVDTQ